GMSEPQAEEQFAEPFKRISAEEAKELIDEGGVSVIDVREDWEFNAGHVPQAKHIPLSRLISAAQKHVERDTIVFDCKVRQPSAGHERSAPSERLATILGVRIGGCWSGRRAHSQ